MFHATVVCFGGFWCGSTHGARSWVGDVTLVLDPAIVGTFFMGKWSVESSSNGRHGEHTHCWTTKYGAVEEKGGVGDGCDRKMEFGRLGEAEERRTPKQARKEGRIKEEGERRKQERKDTRGKKVECFHTLVTKTQPAGPLHLWPWTPPTSDLCSFALLSVHVPAWQWACTYRKRTPSLFPWKLFPSVFKA